MTEPAPNAADAANAAEADRSRAYAILRITLGAILLIPMLRRFVAPDLAAQFAQVLPYIEAVLGGLLLLGLLTRWALLAGALLTIPIAALLTLSGGMEALAGALLLALVYFTLLTQTGRNAFSVDALFRR